MFFSRNSRAAALGSPSLHFYVFTEILEFWGVGMGLGCMELGCVMGVLLQIFECFLLER